MLSDVCGADPAGLARPVAPSARAIDRVGEMLAVYDENARLREENRRLLGWQTDARQARRREPGAARHAERAGGRSRAGLDHGPRRRRFRRRRSCAACWSMPAPSEGVAMGMAAMTAEGLVGRVFEVGRRSARILLITDYQLARPGGASSARATAPMLAGDNSTEPAAALPAAGRRAAGRRSRGDLGPRRRAAAPGCRSA